MRDYWKGRGKTKREKLEWDDYDDNTVTAIRTQHLSLFPLVAFG
jgi:hypothetical protein